MWDLLKQNRPDSYDKADKYGKYGKVGKAEQFVKTEFVQTARFKQHPRNDDHDYDGQEVSPADYKENGIEPYDFDTGYSSD